MGQAPTLPCRILVPMTELHERLVALQSDAELERKWRKAQGRWSNQYWAQEWLDVARRRAYRLWCFLGWGVWKGPKPRE